jgi:hypothetical protein
MAIAAGLQNRIVAAGVKGMTAPQADDCLKKTPYHSVFSYRLKGITGTTGIKPTGRCLKR